jgi:hypothetical protein
MAIPRRARLITATGRRFLRLAQLAALGLYAAAAQQPSASAVKAAFLLNFTKFVTWPASAFENAQSPLAICLLGEDPFGRALDELVEGETVDGRRLMVRRIDHAPEPKACQVLYVNGQPGVLGEILGSLPAGVLTVGDEQGFLRDGGIIAFVIDHRHVRFDINQRAAARASLTLSARLLNVARSVQK